MRRAAICAALVAGLASVHGTSTADTGPGDSELRAFADLVTAGLAPAPDGRTPQAIVDSGSGERPRSTASATVGEGPEATSAVAAFAYGLTHPDAAPAGANRWDCVPDARHPHPVVLLHGTWLNAYDTFSYLSPRLVRAGFCVFALNYGRSALVDGGGVGSVLPGRYGVGAMEDSARQVAEFVDRVRAATGADKVDLVGPSQGGTVANRYLEFEGGAAAVGRVVTYGATHHGTTLLGIAALGRAINDLGVNILGFYEPIIGPANIQQTVGSPFYAALNARGDTVPGVDYTVVGTRYDEITTPYERTFLRAGEGATVHNVTVQDGCEQDMSDHMTLMYSPRGASLALAALDPAGRPDPECAFNPG